MDYEQKMLVFSSTQQNTGNYSGPCKTKVLQKLLSIYVNLLKWMKWFEIEASGIVFLSVEYNAE